MDFKKDKNGKIVLTKEDAIREHRKMWLWIADKIKESNYKLYITKTTYLTEVLGFSQEEVVKKNIIKSECFLCHYAYNQEIRDMNNIYHCQFCPLDWCSTVKSLMCVNKDKDNDYKGLFKQYAEAMISADLKEVERIAREIASLKEI